MRQERIIVDGELIKLSGALFDRVSGASPGFSPEDSRDSLSAIEVEVLEGATPTRVRRAWTMALIGVAAMVGTLAAQVHQGPAVAKAHPVVRAGAPALGVQVLEAPVVKAAVPEAITATRGAAPFSSPSAPSSSSSVAASEAAASASASSARDAPARAALAHAPGSRRRPRAPRLP